MRASDIFDVVHNRVIECRLAMQSTGGTTLPDGLPHGGGKAHVGNRHAEYVGDFALAGRKMLKPWPRQLELFRLYFVRGEKPQRREEPVTCRVLFALGSLALPERTFFHWCAQIKHRVAPELCRRGLFPPREYHIPEWQKHEDLSEYTTRFLDPEEFRGQN